MAPPPWLRHRGAHRAHPPDATRLCIVVGVIAGILVLTGLATAALVLCRRRSSSYQEVGAKEWPPLKGETSRADAGVSMSENLTAHEYQRVYMIRKTLASRAASLDAQADDGVQKPTRSLGGGATTPCMEDASAGRPSLRPGAPMTMADELKEWEARMQREGVRSLKFHPAVGGAVDRHILEGRRC